MKQNDIEILPTLKITRLENLFEVYTDNNDRYFYNLLKTIHFDEKSTPQNIYKYYTVMNGDTYTYISYKTYSTIDLWWLVCAFNNIKDPTKMPEPGTQLKILFSEYVSNILTAIKNR